MVSMINPRTPSDVRNSTPSHPWRSLLRRLTILAGLTLCSATLAKDVYVSPAGQDTHPGTRARPVATLAQARAIIQPFVGKEPVMVHVADGIYYLPETLVFSTADSGSREAPVIYRAQNEGKAVLSGGSKISLTWTAYRHGIFMARAPRGLEIDQLFINGRRQRMARYPNYDARKKVEAYQGFASDAFSRERAAHWTEPAGGYIHAMHRARWGGYHYRITGKDANGEVTYEGGWQNNRQMGMHKEFRMVENIFEELDAPGEWFHNAKTHTLYYQPEPSMDLDEAVVEVVRLRHLIEFQGSLETPVTFITLQGFVMRHTARTFMETREPLLRSDWAIYRGGAVKLTGTEDVHILDTEFDQVGGNAVFVSQYNRRTLIKGCHIHDTGASGVCFVGDPDAVRNPLFEYRQKNDLTQIDRTPGPKTPNYPSCGRVEDCLIHGIGRVERQPAGVQISMSQDITVRDCSIYDCARAGINISEGTWGGHLIERCDVFDTVLETHDHGSFNSWGRDRYWRSDHLKASQEAVDQDPQLPFLDAMKTTVIRNSRWRCDHGWDIDLDDGSSNYDLYNNLLLQGGLKFREGFRRRAWNNITVNNGFHPHVWFNHSEDEAFANIFMASPRGARMPSEIAKGKRVDGNLYYAADAKVKDRFVQFGWDVNSILGDPLFVDPARADFRVKPGSPAFNIGFKNFPMDQFGVKKPALKAIARTPVIPKPRMAEQREPSRPAAARMPIFNAYWLGAKLHSLTGEEYSAYGVARDDGGVALVEVPPASMAAQAGFKTNDLIQRLNGKKVINVDALLKAYGEVGEAPLKVLTVRNQKPQTLEVRSAPFVALESASSASGFARLKVPAQPAGKISVNQPTHNDPLGILVDGRLAQGYGPVFGNGTTNGAYKMALGASTPVAAITSWSFNEGERRAAQRVTLFGSNMAADPGWDITDRARFTPLGTLDTTRMAGNTFRAVSLRARAELSLGTFRWIVWAVSPVTSLLENTAFQELSVE